MTPDEINAMPYDVTGAISLVATSVVLVALAVWLVALAANQVRAIWRDWE